MMFSSQIINGDNYRQWKKTRGLLFIIWFFVGFPAWFMAGRDKDGTFYKDYLHSPFAYYAGFILIAALLYYLLTYYSFKYETIGELYISPDRVAVVVNNKEETWFFDQVKTIEITRNTTYHKNQYREEEKIFPGNNFVRIIDDKSNIFQYEFLIMDKTHDEEFQRMIDKLQFNILSGRRFLSI